MVETDELREWLSACRHDGLNSLSHVVGYAGILLSGPADDLTDEQRRYVDTIRRSAQRSAECWDIALLYLELGTGEPAWEPRRLSEVVERAADLLRQTGEAQPLRIHAPADLPAVRADRQLETALFYLLAPEAGRFTYTRDFPTAIEASLADSATIQVRVHSGLSLPARRYRDPARLVAPGTRFGAAELILRHYGSRLEMQAGEEGTTWTFALAAWAGDES